MIKRFTLPLFLLAASLLLGGCATYTDVREHREIAQEAQNIGSVVILPPEVAIELVTFTGENERETAKQDGAAALLTDNAKNALEAQGLNVVDFDFSKAAADHPELAYAVTQCVDALKKAEKTLYAKPVEEKNKSTFGESVGASANTIAEITGADALLWINYQGFEKSSGMVAKDIAAGVLLGLLTGQAAIAPSEGSVLEMALIAADSGNVLWVNRKGMPQLNGTAQVHDLVMKEFPKTQWRARQEPAAPGQSPAIETTADAGAAVATPGHTLTTETTADASAAVATPSQTPATETTADAGAAAPAQ